MLNRILASVAILSLLVAVTVAVLWWRANRGHSDTVLHLGANSPHQTTLYTGPVGIALSVQDTAPDGSIGDHVKLLPFRTVLGGAMVIPSLVAAIWLRRRLLPRRPGSEIPALGRR